ncbi:MAG: helix-turn-helix domain-containing protein [Spirochaetia bacterium]|nr:helix-turn-helix domain-containing protein [Spirochaetia bacterium]
MPSPNKESPPLRFLETRSQLLSCRIHQADARWKTGVRVLENHFILHTLSGRCTAKVEGKTFSMGAGNFLFISPGQKHSLGPGVPGAMPKNAALHFQVTDKLGIPVRDFFSKPVWKTAEPDLWKMRFQALAAASEKDRGRLGEWLLGMLFLDLEMSGYPFKIQTASGDPRIIRSLARIHASDTKPPSLSELATASGLGRAQFRRLFAKELRVTPKKFLERLQLSRAAELLLSTDLRVKEVARRTGYDDEHHFQKRFRKAYGSSPGDFRLRPWE